ncbi:hypothetical protein RISK_002070 [Rhodopirellula islandica]|uniref:Uncharacterized protein n=1 Tax=Rhodopirellula islandica TaxID=595434 RepID=A0A0J1BFX0_RHOIS|nr:hypothetical protein RISK_002070 [Rhodopirellula islandica]
MALADRSVNHSKVKPTSARGKERTAEAGFNMGFHIDR